MNDKHEPRLLTVQRILSGTTYAIPVYQRNYAWGIKEISQLIADVRDYAQRHAQDKGHDYYIGTLVVYRRSTDKQAYWEVVDGQQRLTTLSLLVSVLRALHPELASAMQGMPLRFECREASSQALQAVFAEPLKPQVLRQDDMHKGSAEDVSGARSIWQGRSIIAGLLHEMPEGERKTFAHFLLHRVLLLRVELPVRTDLNHYFEVMNNRGEQLAKHEVLKARLMGRLQEQAGPVARHMLSTVWDACAVMDRSVLSGFVPELRKRLFRADGAVLLVQNEVALLECFSAEVNSTVQPKSLQQLIAEAAHGERRVAAKKQSVAAGDDEEDESQAQFGSVINFPNFLLQVLAMMPGEEFVQTPLDDKHLLTAFEPLLRSDKGQIQAFAFRLLRCRFLLDQHVIKSSLDSAGDEEHWQLQRCKFRNDKATLQWVNAFEAHEQGFTERLRMLQAALHVSYMLPTRKHWLQGALRWLYRQPGGIPIQAQDFLLALESLAKAFVLEEGDSVTYEQIVRRVDASQADVATKEWCVQSSSFSPMQADSAMVQALPKKLTYRHVRLIDFNFIDYLLWLQAQSVSASKHTAQARRNFEFTSTRRSVEHLHPQTALVSADEWPDKSLHALGNLCLVSHTMNSRLSNSGADDKFKQLMSDEYRESQSMKVFAMHGAFIKHSGWSRLPGAALDQHSMHITELLRAAFACDGLIQCDALVAVDGSI